MLAEFFVAHVGSRSAKNSQVVFCFFAHVPESSLCMNFVAFLYGYSINDFYYLIFSV